MPLPNFLFLIAAVILAAAATIWLATMAGVPLALIGMLALTGAAIAHFLARDHRHH